MLLLKKKHPLFLWYLIHGKVSVLQLVTKAVRLARLTLIQCWLEVSPLYSMLIAGLIAHSWAALLRIAFQSWHNIQFTFNRLNFFQSLFFWKYSETQLFLSSVVKKCVNFSGESYTFWAVNRSLSFNNTGFMVGRDILPVFCFICFVSYPLRLLG